MAELINTNLEKVELKPETCEQQLRRMCKNVEDEITEGKEDAGRWMERSSYDIRYYVDHNKMFLGAEILVAGGGPTIWVNTYDGQVQGYWGGDKVLEHFVDNLGLDHYCEEMYGY